MKNIIIILIICISFKCNGQLKYLNFSYKSVSNHDNYEEESFLLIIPDSITNKLNITNYLIKNPEYFKSLLNEFTNRIYYTKNAAQDIILNNILTNQSVYVDSATQRFNHLIIDEFIYMEKLIDLVSTNDTIIQSELGGSELKLSIVKLPCLNYKFVDFSHITGLCKYYYFEQSSIKHINPTVKHRTGVVCFE
jgi:hypothetical protein